MMEHGRSVPSKCIVDGSESLVAEWIQESVAAEVQIANITTENDLTIDFQPEGVPILDGHIMDDDVAVSSQHFLQSLKTVCSVSDDAISEVWSVIDHNLGQLRHRLTTALTQRIALMTRLAPMTPTEMLAPKI